MEMIPIDYPRDLAALLQPIHEAITDSATTDEADALKEAAKSIALRLKDAVAIQGGEA